MSCSAVAIGCSAGGFQALDPILSALPAAFLPPILIVQHLHAGDAGLFAEHLSQITALPVVEPCDKTPIEASHVYVAPANYHLLVASPPTISLSVDPPVNYSRPAIDVLFESAAQLWGESLVAVLLSGASTDGTAGMRAVKAAGGLTIAQAPSSAEVALMPQSAIDAGVADEILPASKIAGRLLELAKGGQPRERT